MMLLIRHRDVGHTYQNSTEVNRGEDSVSLQRITTQRQNNHNSVLQDDPERHQNSHHQRRSQRDRALLGTKVL